MVTRTGETTPLLNARIEILGQDALEAPPAKEVFGTAITILTLLKVSTPVSPSS